MSSNAENGSIWWRHHDLAGYANHRDVRIGTRKCLFRQGQIFPFTGLFLFYGFEIRGKPFVPCKFLLLVFILVTGIEHLDVAHEKVTTSLGLRCGLEICHYNYVIMSTMASQITSLTIVCSRVYSGSDQRKRQSFASLAFVWGIHRWPVNSPYKWPVTRKMFPFDDVIMADINTSAVRIWENHQSKNIKIAHDTSSDIKKQLKIILNSWSGYPLFNNALGIFCRYDWFDVESPKFNKCHNVSLLTWNWTFSNIILIQISSQHFVT